MLLVPWPSVDIHVKFCGDRPKGIPTSGELNTRGVAEYIDLDLSNAISPKRCKIEAKLVLITNRKSHMSFRLVPNSMTLDDLKRRNSPNHAFETAKMTVFYHTLCKTPDAPLQNELLC